MLRWHRLVPRSFRSLLAALPAPPAAGRRGPAPFLPRSIAPILAAIAAPIAAFAGDVVINEIHYDAPDATVREEFIELHNQGAEAVDISAWFFSGGVSFVFPPETVIPPGGYLVLAEDPATVESVFRVPRALGPYGGRLKSDGERIALRDPTGWIQDLVEFGVGFPWPVASAGDGASMELIHPSLDNDLGSSWRASGFVSNPPAERHYYIAKNDAAWRYRKGTSAPSDPAAAWRELDFVEDDTWLTGTTSIGFGDDDDSTVLDDMIDQYTSVYMRHEFTLDAAGELPSSFRLSYYVDDGFIAWINGIEVARVNVVEGEIGFDGTARRGSEAEWINLTLANAAATLRPGRNVLAVHALNQRRTSNDFSADFELFLPGAIDLEENSFGPPTPGARNSVFAANAPPQIRQVVHTPGQPSAGADVFVTANVTDPQGVASVQLHYQVVAPGSYLPARLPLPYRDLIADASEDRPRNPDFEAAANWTTISMSDDGRGGDAKAGDGIYIGRIPGQANRTLLRYRITVTDSEGASARVPYSDDPRLNFACFVYDGVPAWATTRASVQPEGAGYVYPKEVMESVPVYTLISREADIIECVAANPAVQIPQGTEARFAENWEGAFVADGIVYDHVRYRLRGANGRYQTPPGNPGNVAGKRHWRILFNKGQHFLARDRFGNPYPTRWRVINTDRMFGNRIDGNWGLGDQVNDIIWSQYGVPAPFGHVFHFRVLDGVDEAPEGPDGQYLGDFWGIERAFENYDVRFLESHGLPKGNLYKLVNQTNSAKDQQRYQAPDAVGDGSDHNNIESNLRPGQTDAWLDAYVNYDEWFRYHAIAQAIRHYDYWPEANKNATWYFEPVYIEANRFLGRMWTLPFDCDATWGPTWNDGRDRPYEAIFGGGGKPEFQKGYRNHIREVRDLLWQPDQLQLVIRHTASFMAEIEKADIDRWRNAPPAAGRQWFPSPRESTLEGKANDMLAFAFTGGSWAGGNVAAGGRAAFLDGYDRTDSRNLPEKPVISYTGEAGYPLDGLAFQAGDFVDPQGAEDFRGIEWRLAEVSPISDPQSLPLTDPSWRAGPMPLEIAAIWKSGMLDASGTRIAVPSTVVEAGKTYRARARVHDQTGLASHWSDPIQFVAGGSLAPSGVQTALRITEILFHPLGDEEYEFIELANIGSSTIDVSAVRIEDAITFTFAGSDVESIGPGEHVVVVKDRAVFATRYDEEGIRIAGEFSGNLSNAGERIAIVEGKGRRVLELEYDDAWYPEADGLGRSLVAADAATDPATWSQPAAWTTSAEIHGSPGREDSVPAAGLQLPGDLRADGAVDVSDAIQLLRIVAGGLSVELPCGAGTAEDSANRRLLDIDGDGSVQLTDPIYLLGYLFLAGPPPALGTECARIEGCRSDCAR